MTRRFPLWLPRSTQVVAAAGILIMAIGCADQGPAPDRQASSAVASFAGTATTSPMFLSLDGSKLIEIDRATAESVTVGAADSEPLTAC